MSHENLVGSQLPRVRMQRCVHDRNGFFRVKSVGGLRYRSRLVTFGCVHTALNAVVVEKLQMIARLNTRP